jgi:hypothetical protein
MLGMIDEEVRMVRMKVLDPTAPPPEIGADPGPDAGALAGRLVGLRYDRTWRSFEWVIDEWTGMLGEFSWSAARRCKHVVFGPRFAFYPAVIQLADGRPGLDIDLAVVEDQSAIDRLCRFALARYQAWAQRPPDTVRVTADGASVPVEQDGSFSAPGATVVLVAAGPDATDISIAQGTLPFPDARLA